MGSKAVLLDLDGVVYVDNKPIEGALQTIEFVEKNKIPYRFLSNTTRKSRETIKENLEKMGIRVSKNMIFTPAYAAASFLKQKQIETAHLLLTGDSWKDFAAEGITHHDEADCLVVGDAGDEFTYSRLVGAFRLILRGALFIALERDRYWMGRDGLLLSAGPFVKALEYAAGPESILIGKPSKEFFMLAISDIGLSPGDCIMMGDDIETDIKGALSAGMEAILVRTGKFSAEKLEMSAIKPTAVIDSIEALTHLL